MLTSRLCLSLLALLAASPVTAQVATRFTTGGRDIVRVDIAGTAVGDFPAGIQMIDGIMEVVDFNGQRMLRASSRSSFLVRLPQVLPQDFALEFEIVPKASGNPEDLAVEGTPTINQGAGSANVMWHRDYLQIVGGGATYDSKVPASFAAGLPGVLTHIAITMQGPMMKLYTNGRLMYTQQRQFVRGRVLRVFLGGQDDGPNAVYLASMRVVDAVGPVGPIAGGASTGPAASDGAPSPLPQSQNPLPTPRPDSNTTQNTSGLTGSGAPAPGTTIVQNVTVTMTSSGPLVSWQHGTAPAVYRVQRFKTDDPSCCNNTSPASPALVAPPWQDSPPPISGTYTYQVTATSSSGSAMAGTNFDFIAGTATGPTVAAAQSPGPRTISAAAPPTVMAPAAPGAAPVDATFAVTVTLGNSGPIVTWNAVPQATGYVASRTKSDDLNCCNTASGARTFTATSPWQDQPLPMTGTYDYQVVANTPTGQVSARTQFQYTAPPAGPETLGRAPTSPPAAPNAPASASFAIRYPTPTKADFEFEAVPGAVGYRIRRSVTGSGTWIDVTPTPLTPPPPPPGWTQVYPDLRDTPLDHRLTYTYELHSLQADGTYGTNTLTHTPPAPADPSTFTATPQGPGTIMLEWTPVAGGPMYRIDGPGTGSGVTVYGDHYSPPGKRRYTLSGVPVGTHTWTIASDYQPGGILTPSTSWTRASATVAAPDPAPRYRLVALGIRADRQSRDIDDARDGVGDEVYFRALVNQTTLTGVPLPVVGAANLTHVATRSLGAENVAVPYGRIKAGTASAFGGIKTGDAVPADLDLLGGTPSTLHNNQFPLRIWEGSLEGNAVVVVHPALWEDDVDPRVQANWLMLLSNEAGASYSPQADTRYNTAYVTDVRTYHNYKRIFSLSGGTGFAPRLFDANPPGSSRDIGSTLLQCTTIAVNLIRRPCEAHGVDRPIGLWGGSNPGDWSDLPIVITKAAADRLLAAGPTSEHEPLGTGTFIVWLYDDVGTPATTEAIAQYRLYLRLERVP